MSKIDFGIIFIAKESELDARNLYLDIDSVFFSVDEVIKTGRYKDTNLSDLKMVMLSLKLQLILMLLSYLILSYFKL